MNDWDDNSNNMVTFDPAMPPVLEDGDYTVRRLESWTPPNVNAALENSAYARSEMNSSDQRKVDSLRAEVLRLIEENRLLENDYFCLGEKASLSSALRMNRLFLLLLVYVAFDYAFTVPFHGFAVVSRRP